MSSLRSIVICFILQNTLCKIELFAEYRYLSSDCRFGYCVMERCDFPAFVAVTILSFLLYSHRNEQIKLKSANAEFYLK